MPVPRNVSLSLEKANGVASTIMAASPTPLARIAPFQSPLKNLAAAPVVAEAGAAVGTP